MGNISAAGAAQENAIQAAQTFSASLSIFACIFMSYKIWRERSSNLTNKMLALLFFVDFCLALMYGVGRAGTLNPGFCQFQAIIIQWFSIVAILWVVLMSWQMRKWIVLRKDTKKIEHSLKNYTIAIFSFSAALAFALFGVDIYGPAYLWCWIEAIYPDYRIGCFDTFLFLAWITIVYILWEVTASLNARMKASSIDMRIGELFNSNVMVQRKMVMYVTLFIFIWSFVLFNRLLEKGLNGIWYPAALAQALFLPLQGFFNAICYGGYLDGINLPWMSKHEHRVFWDNDAVRHEEEVDARAMDYTVAPPMKSFHPKAYSIFVSTLNMGEATAHSVTPNLKDWILEGHDVYAIGLQECVDLLGIREIILNHLGGPGKYTMYTTEIGSGNTSLGFHGFIALTLYVRASEIEQGHIHMTKPASETMATGTDLIITTAQNKGAVGLPLQIHDTNIGFVTCHLPSDSKGKSKLSKRNASAHSILKEVALAQEDLGFDLHLQHDHVLVFGDLNYRMNTNSNGVNTLAGVANASIIEKEKLNGDPSWVQRRYNLLRHKSDPQYPTIEEIKALKLAKVSSRGAWNSVLVSDELRSIMDDGDAFAGFDEPMPSFAPSYKRRKGAQGDCGDYTDVQKILQGYSNILDIEQEFAVQQRRASQISQQLPHVRPPAVERARSGSSSMDQQQAQSIMRDGSRSRAESEGNLIPEPSSPNRRSKKAVGATADADATAGDRRPKRTMSGSKIAGFTADVVTEVRQHSDDSVGSARMMSGESTDGVRNVSGESSGSRKASSDRDSDDEEGAADDMVGERKRASKKPFSNELRASESAADSDDETPAGDAQEEKHEDDTRRSSFERPSAVGGRSKRRQAQVLAQPYEPEPASTKKIDPRKLRPPSYTDRILVHSLVDRKPRLTIQSYDLCDTLRISDHRAVSMTVLLEVNASITYKSPILTQEKLLEPRFELYELCITDIAVKMTNLEDLDEEEGDSDDETEVESVVSANSGGNPLHASESAGKKSTRKKSVLDVILGVNSTTTLDASHRITRGHSDSVSSASGVEIEMKDQSQSSSAGDRRSKKSVGFRDAVEDDDVFSVASTSFSSSQAPPAQEQPAKNTRKKSMFAFFSSDEGSSAASGSEGSPKKSRKRSMFGKRSSAIGVEEQAKNDLASQAAALEIKDMERESMAWKNELHQPGEWKKRVLAEEKRRKEEKANTVKGKLHIKKKHKREDRMIHQVTVVFPLPSKDPLLAHRKMYDFSQVFNFKGNEEAEIATAVASSRSMDYAVTEEVRKPEVQTTISREELLKPMSVFPWKQTSKRSVSNSVVGNTFRVKGCASPELGAHVLLKFTNKLGYDMGSCVVCVSKLINTDLTKILSAEFTGLPLSSGGQVRGEVSGKFSLKYIPSPLSADYTL